MTTETTPCPLCYGATASIQGDVSLGINTQVFCVCCGLSIARQPYTNVRSLIKYWNTLGKNLSPATISKLITKTHVDFVLDRKKGPKHAKT